MVLFAYMGFSGALLVSAVTLLWMLGMPPEAILPVALQLAGVCAALALVAEVFAAFVRKGHPAIQDKPPSHASLTMSLMPLASVPAPSSHNRAVIAEPKGRPAGGARFAGLPASFATSSAPVQR